SPSALSWGRLHRRCPHRRQCLSIISISRYLTPPGLSPLPSHLPTQGTLPTSIPISSVAGGTSLTFQMAHTASSSISCRRSLEPGQSSQQTLFSIPHTEALPTAL